MPQLFDCSEINTKLTVDKMNKVCKYHKLLGQQYVKESLTCGICPVLHNTIYPYGLSMFYDRPVKTYHLHCSINPKIKVRIFKKRKWPIIKYIMYYIIIKFMAIIGLPWDIELIDVFYDIEGDLSCKYYKENETFRFNSDDKYKLCPASYYTIYPAILSDIETVQCVDHEGIIYRNDNI